MRENKRGGALSKVQRLKKRLSQSFGKLGKNTKNKKERGCIQKLCLKLVLSIQMSN